MKFSLSFIIAVYNKPDILRLVLAACARQSFTDFEVIVADDGSGPAVREVVAEAQGQYPYPLTHLWQEDKGWCKNAILNAAIRASRSDYLVFTDGDCLPSRHFLSDHARERGEGKILLGRRVETSERWSKSLTLEKIESGRFERLGFREWADGLMGCGRRLEDGIRIQNRLGRKLLKRDAHRILGSNFSVAKKHLEEINGFDEDYSGPGSGEDSDLQYRLSLVGVTGKSLRNLAIQFHVYHSRTKTDAESRRRLTEVMKRKEPRCEKGLYPARVQPSEVE
ncbi:MAG: glycosyltransferase [candidate division Zixibacteria bacterium]|nr:glycosyltransferase [candidate division Zixibacteria bacterium]